MSSAAQWTFAVGPWNPAAIVCDVNAAHSRTVTFNLTDNSEASFTIDGRDPSCRDIVELSTDLYVYRRQRADLRGSLLYRGRIGKSSDVLDADGHSVTVPSVDYRCLLRRRLLMHGARQRWDNTDQAHIAWDLIQQAQQRTGGDMGIRAGHVATGVRRDRSYELGSSIGEKIQELSEVINGFDWDITATDTDSLGLQLDVWHP
ncbi:hypothetical protein [Pseudonocardia sp. ICBG1142]|uniref:hypothetical protein n=1 Tax=Pseudonocardia sp. ICBG1142 TaxID=2846760 RepID=UPI001CF69157|nr:hypothetical protein [Pseudonocardia sp. ICBG1142]